MVRQANHPPIEGSLPVRALRDNRDPSTAQTTVINGRQGDGLNFQVNEQTYFLDLEEDASKWVVFVETPTGTRQVPVHVDAPPCEDLKVVVEHRDKHKIVN